MKILITGATGFVGRALSKRLLADSHMVHGTLLAPELSDALVPGVEPVVIETLGPATQWQHALVDVDTIIHLAARVHIMHDAAADPLTAFRLVNVEGTKRLALEAAKAGVKRLVFVSSVKVHGEESSMPYSEVSRYAPLDPYGVSKMEGEQALLKIESETGLEVVIVRPPLVYGVGVKANFLRMMQVIQRCIPLPLASIKNRRSLIYLGNLVDALAACSKHPNAAGQIYLVSDGVDFSTPGLIRSVAAAMGVSAHLFPVPVAAMQLLGMLAGKKMAVQRLTGSLAVNSSKIRRELGWKPPFAMEEGLKETAEWFKKCKT